MVLRRLLREHHGQQEIKWNENEEQRGCTKLGGFDRGGKETAVEPFGDFSTRRLCRHCCNVVVSVERNGVDGRVVEELRGFTAVTAGRSCWFGFRGLEGSRPKSRSGSREMNYIG